MSTTPNLELELVPSNSLQPYVAVNDALQVLDALVQLAVQEFLDDPPTTTSDNVGDRWIIGTTPTGEWADYGNYIALCTAAETWRYIEPKEGFKAWNISDYTEYRYAGGTWYPITEAGS